MLRVTSILPVLCAAASAAAADSLVNFDSFAVAGITSLAPADFFASQGVVFAAPIPLTLLGAQEVPFVIAFESLGATAPNALALDINLGQSAEAHFRVPGPPEHHAVTTAVSALFGDGQVGSILGTLQAFDAKGNLLAEDSMTTPTEMGGVLTVAAPRIARIRFSVDSDGAVIDNLTFSTPTPWEDLNGDGSVNAGDIAILLGAWGPCAAGPGCDADLDLDDVVGSSDLAMMLGAWTP